MGRSWTCGDPLIDTRDLKAYKTVMIGNQCWMAQNLNIGTIINSNNGGNNNDGEQSDNTTIEKYCYWDEQDSCDIYGGFYLWDEMINYSIIESSRGICPEDWHVPSDEIFEQTLYVLVSKEKDPTSFPI